jgi:hypothetical protein
VNRLYPSRDQRPRQLLTLEEMGDHKPSQFLRRLRSPSRTYRTTFCAFSGPAGYPPISIPLLLVCPRSGWTLLPYAKIASPRPSPRLRSRALAKYRTVQRFWNASTISRQLANLTAERNRPNSKELCTRSSDRQFNLRDRRSRSSDRCCNSRSHCSHRCSSRHDTANTFCWYRGHNGHNVVPIPAGNQNNRRQWRRTSALQRPAASSYPTSAASAGS